MRLQSKILLVALPLTLVFAGLTAFVGYRATERLMVRELGRRLRPQTEDFAAGLARNWDARRESALLARLQQAQAFSGAAFVEALSPGGVVLAHTNVLETGKRRDDEDARAALAASETSYARASGPRGMLLVPSAPVWKADEDFLLSGGPRRRLGTVRFGLPLEETLGSARRVGALVSAMAAGFCLLALGAMLVFVRSLLLRPVRAIAAATSRVAAGDYGVQVPVPSRDELGELARSFNAMGAALSRTVVSRDRLEEALAISRATLDASADGILVVDQNLHAITYNSRFAEMYGLPEDLLRAGDVRAMAEFVRNQFAAEEEARFLDLSTAPVVGDQERRDLLRLKDGRIFDRISHVYRIGGKEMGRTITTRDMTLHFEGVRALAQARDIAEEALAISRATIDASADGILVIGKGLKVITCNKRFLEMWSIPEEMARAGADNLLLHEIVKPQLLDLEGFARGATSSDKDFEFGERRDVLRLKDGRVFERINRPYLIKGRTMGRTLTFRDLTLHFEDQRALGEARDKAEEALAISRATIDASADGILVVGKGAKFITHNNRFLEMWNIPADMTGEGSSNIPVVEYVRPQVLNVEPFDQGVVATDEDFGAPERRDLLRLKDGRVFERVSRPYLRGGRATGRTFTFRDLTLHLEGLRALADARDEAVETARVKSQFLANVSHEIRTPLNAVIGSAEMLLGTRLDAEQREHAETLNRASRTLLELVSGVLDFAKIEAGRMTVERSRLHPDEILSDAAALLAPRAAEKGLTLKTSAGAAASLDLLGDPTRLRQVLLNLLANAVKFTDRGGVEASIDVLSSDGTSAELEFSVNDTGIGIPPEQAEKIFTPFMQGDGSTTRRFGGTGLGLAISRTLVELMGGTIGFESKPGGGARFWFRLRLDRADASSPPAPAPPLELAAPSQRRDRMRVLVVDDNETNRRLLQRQLSRLGCPSVAVDSGSAALDELGASQFGLILLDCQMPGLDGYATAAEIRRRETGRRRTPIAAITANTTKDVRKRCEDSGMDDFAPKPATLRDLAALIERWDRPFDETALQIFSSVAAEGAGGVPGLLADFAADARTRLQAAGEGLARGDFNAARREAHAVKGASAAVGARGLAELCRRLEDCFAAADEALDAALEAEASALLAQAEAEAARVSAEAARRAA